MSLPTLSVIVANYNHARLLPRALNAMLQQSLPALEILVIDDGSRDDSRAVLADLAQKHRLIRPHQNDRNRGVAYTMNRGMDLARGDYVYLAAADDMVLPGFFQRAMRRAAQHPKAGLIFGQMGMMNEQEKMLGHFGASAWKEDGFAPPDRFRTEFLEREAPTHSLCAATIYKKSAILEMGGYREQLGHWMDSFVARATGLKYGAIYLHDVVMAWQIAESGLAQSTPLEKTLTIHRRAAALMRSDPFRPIFPPDHVDHWEKAYCQEVFRDSIRRRQAWLRAFHYLGKPGWKIKEFLVRQLARVNAWRWRHWQPSEPHLPAAG